MTSIVITPFDNEHAAEYKSFIENEIENADFEVDMPACIELLDVRELQQKVKTLTGALKGMLEVFVDCDSYADYEDMESVKAARKALTE